VVAALVAAVVLGGPPGECSRAEAKQSVLASQLPAPLKERVRVHRYGRGGIGWIYCFDVTGDRRRDMILTFASGGSGGDVGWVIFRRLPSGRFRLALDRHIGPVKLFLTFQGADVVEHNPVVYHSPEYDHARWRWTGSRFAIVRKWHTKSWTWHPPRGDPVNE
jgi:hypothetical protein